MDSFKKFRETNGRWVGGLGAHKELVSDVALCVRGRNCAWSRRLWAEPRESKQGADWDHGSRLRRLIG